MLISKDKDVVKNISSVLITFLFISICSFLIKEFVFKDSEIVFYISSSIFWVSFILLIFSLFFFRDPERIPPEGENLIISPADGRILEIKNDSHEYFNQEMKKISIFMSVFNVHINRSPIKGIVNHYKYKPGKFFNASFDKASEFNEQNFIVIKNENIEIGVKQIAGLIARRIAFWKETGSHVEIGEKFGLIRFGSRLEVFVPKETKIKINVGEKVKAGFSILGEYKNES